MNIQQAVNQFIAASSAHAVATESGDYKTANKKAVIIAKCAGFLKSDSSTLELEPYLIHPSVGVRCMVASYLLPFSEVESILVLKKIAFDKSVGIQSLNAETVLSEWKEGKLNLYYILPSFE